jgi:hypothetical protein
MISGFHSHYCPRCQEQKDCSQITHCQKTPTALCADCVYDDFKNGTLPEKKTWHFKGT